MNAERLAATFVDLADTLVDDFDLVEFLYTLVDRCAELLDVSAVGLMLADARGRLTVMASTSRGDPAARTLPAPERSRALPAVLPRRRTGLRGRPAPRRRNGGRDSPRQQCKPGSAPCTPYRCVYARRPSGH